MKELLRSAVIAASGGLSESQLRSFARYSLNGASVALCLHRVAQTRRPGEWDPSLTIAPGELDALIEFLLSTRPRTQSWLTVAFDDGYEDAAQYILTSIDRFPTVEWIYFVCPEKIEHRVGFRWDLFEQKQKAGIPVDFDAVMFGDLDVEAENRRSDLKGLCTLPEYRLADVDLCRELHRLPRVSLGNHTNGHFCQTLLTLNQASEEYRRSVSDFARLFGPQSHFAFPFGTPQESFEQRHVSELRARGSFTIWSTEQRPYAPGERKPGAVLPRYPIDGTRTWRQSAFSIALYAAKWRMRGTRFTWPDERDASRLRVGVGGRMFRDPASGGGRAR
ncbi:MAG: hypothetical protein WBV82_29360 [Myxococcaceae bacterium]